LFLQSNERSGHGRADVKLFCCKEAEKGASVFFHLLNIAGIKAQVVYFSNTQDKILRRHFLGQLSEALTTQHIKTRLMNSSFPRQLTTRINLYLEKVHDEQQEVPVPAPEDQQPKKKQMSYAPEKRTKRQSVLSAESLCAKVMEIITVMTALKCDFFIVYILNNVTMYIFLPKFYSFLVLFYFIRVTAIFQLFWVFCKSERNRNKTYC